MVLQEEEPQVDAKEYKIPAALLLVGILIDIGHTVFTAGVKGVGPELLAMGIIVTVQVILGIIACFITARIMGANFGTLTPAMVKLAAVCVFPGAVALFIPSFIPLVGMFLTPLLFWGLLEWLFELDVMESIVLVFVIWIVQIGGGIVVLAALSPLLT